MNLTKKKGIEFQSIVGHVNIFGADRAIQVPVTAASDQSSDKFHFASTFQCVLYSRDSALE
jgi:hypothetical protein